MRAQLEEAIRCADALRNELERLNQTTAVTLPPPRGAITTTAQRHSVRFEDEAAMATTAAQRRSVHFEDDQMNITPPRSMIQPLTLPTQSESVMSEPSIGSTEEEEFAVSVQASSAPQRGDDEDDSAIDSDVSHDSDHIYLKLDNNEVLPSDHSVKRTRIYDGEGGSTPHPFPLYRRLNRYNLIESRIEHATVGENLRNTLRRNFRSVSTFGPDDLLQGPFRAAAGDDHDNASSSDDERNNSNDTATEMQFQPHQKRSRSGRRLTPNRDDNYYYC